MTVTEALLGLIAFLLLLAVILLAAIVAGTEGPRVIFTIAFKRAAKEIIGVAIVLFVGLLLIVLVLYASSS